MLRFTTTTRLFADKNIGKMAMPFFRYYTVDKPDWDKYNTQITNTYSSNFKHIDDALTDTIISQTNKIRDLDISNYQQSKEIRELQITVKILSEHYLHTKENLYAITKNIEYLTYGVYGVYGKFDELSQKVDDLSKK